MSVYYVLKEYILPKAANFGIENDAEVTKIQYYSDKFEDMFQELIALADWYDKDGDGTVKNDEKLTTRQGHRFTEPTRCRAECKAYSSGAWPSRISGFSSKAGALFRMAPMTTAIRMAALLPRA